MNSRRLVLFALVFITPFSAVFAQQRSQKTAGMAPSPAVRGAASAPEGDTDGADIPPFARDRISEEQYFTLRDQDVRIRRGIDDLVRSPHARSLAVRSMEFHEQILRLAPQALSPFGGLLPFSTPTWTAVGPDPIPNGQTAGGAVAVSGRVTAIVVDPTSDQIIYVGTAQGGVYRSTDAGATWV